MTTNPTLTSICIAILPALGADLDGGTFAGLTTRPDGMHCAVILLPGQAENVTWAQAKAWAAKPVRQGADDHFEHKSRGYLT